MIEVSTGDVACARAADERRPIASTTKLMTALLTLERAKLSRHLHRRPTTAVAAPSRRSASSAGERMSVRDLMRGLLVESANDAAVTLAEGVAARARRSCAR